MTNCGGNGVKMIEMAKSEDELERYLHRVEKLRNASDFPAALEACQPLVDEPTTHVAGLRARADIYADMRQRDLELADREALVDLGSKEPSDHFDLGISLWRFGRIAEAVDAFSRSIELGEQGFPLLHQRFPYAPCGTADKAESA
jgi:tetratricopeptide (TPR) repeat protein